MIFRLSCILTTKTASFDVEHAILVVMGKESKRTAEGEDKKVCQEGKEVTGYALISNFSR